MIPLLESPFAQRLAWTLLHFLWQGALLGLVAWTGFTLLRRRSPRARYVLGCACLLTCLVSAASTLALQPLPAASAVLADGAFAEPSILEAPAATGHPAGEAPAAATPPWPVRLQPFLPWILVAWAAGVLLLSLRTAGGWLWLHRLRSSARPISEPEWLAGLVRRTGLRRAVRFLESVRVATPMCMGLLRPIVLIPLGFFASLDPMAAEAVLAHELAHIRRLDGLVNGLQCVIEVLFFFHPAVWWISRRVRTEREHCCDDAAVLACGDAVFYAETLSRLDEFRDRSSALALLAGGGNLMERLRRLLLSDLPRLGFTTPGLALVALVALAAARPARAEKPAPAPPAVERPASATEPIREDARITIQPHLIQPLPSRAMPALELPSAPGPIATFPLTPVQAPKNLVTEYPQGRQGQAPGTTEPPPQPAEAQAMQEPATPSPKTTRSTPELTAPWPAWQVDRLRPASAAQSSLDCGPEPTQEEALAFVKIMAGRSLWGPRTQVKQVEVVGKSRWYASLTNRWPRGKNQEATIVGWEIAFLAKPSQVMAPYSPFHLRSILVDKDRVVHWHTHTEWNNYDNIMPKR